MTEKTRYTEAQKGAIKKYMDNKVDVLKVYVEKGEKDRIKAAAAAAGESVNGFVKSAINMRMNAENK